MMPVKSDWQDMDTAPRDGTWIVGRDESGREADIQFRNPLASIPDAAGLGSWFEGDPTTEGSWERNICFYPVVWKVRTPVGGRYQQAGGARKETR